MQSAGAPNSDSARWMWVPTRTGTVPDTHQMVKVSRVYPYSAEFAHLRQRFGDTLFLPLPATKEWGEDRGEGRTKAVGTNAPPLPGPLLHPLRRRDSAASPMEEREWLGLRRAGFIRVHRGFRSSWSIFNRRSQA